MTFDFGKTRAGVIEFAFGRGYRWAVRNEHPELVNMVAQYYEWSRGNQGQCERRLRARRDAHFLRALFNYPGGARLNWAMEYNEPYLQGILAGARHRRATLKTLEALKRAH